MASHFQLGTKTEAGKDRFLCSDWLAAFWQKSKLHLEHCKNTL